MSRNLDSLVSEYCRASAAVNDKTKRVDISPVVKVVSAYYMQSDDPTVVREDGQQIPVKLLLSINKKELTVKFIESIIKETWLDIQDRAGSFVGVQNGVLYYSFKEYGYNEALLRKEVCKYIKKLKGALHINELGGNPLAILTAPVSNPELYDVLIKDARELGYSLNELLRLTGVDIVVPDVRGVYKSTGTIILNVDDQVFIYDERTNSFREKSSIAEDVVYLDSLRGF